MSKFKVGDTVRRINRSNGSGHAQLGQEAVVTAVYDASLLVSYGTKSNEAWTSYNAELVEAAALTNPHLAFKSISGERARTYVFPDGATYRVENVTGLCVRPTNHRLQTSDGRKLIVPGKFIAIEIEANGWGV